ncbi:MAG: hypothetical protein IJS19_05025 [Muribaculaceae bacterium]|nr:hypothetical protein [Muribaculaceae bacterium]
MLKKVCILCAILCFCTAVQGEDQPQAALLKKAYEKHSTWLLGQFFDNWSNDVSSNENEAKSKWVAEAHKVFIAFYQPLQLEKIGCGNGGRDQWGEDLYKNVPYFIVQDTLYDIYMTDTSLDPNELEVYYINRINQMYPDDNARKKQLDYLRKEKENSGMFPVFDMDEFILFPSWKIISTTKVDSIISFRPPVHFPDKRIVYLTPEYKRILDSFLGDKHVDLGKESIMQVANSKGESKKRMEFINSAAKIFYGHWGGYWQYETYPKATSIVFDSQMQHAVVFFRFVYEGGEVFLEKQSDEWTIISGRLTWIE